jgi:hypothetical protein
MCTVGLLRVGVNILCGQTNHADQYNTSTTHRKVGSYVTITFIQVQTKQLSPNLRE